jgi:ABC-type transport system involved in multi-copper enzyme maturation permease subunit
MVFYAVLAGVLFGMRAAAGERTRRTAAFLCGLPVRPCVLGMAKLLATIAAVLLPLALLVAAHFAARRLFPRAGAPDGFEWPHYLILLLATSAVMQMVAVFGSGARSEVHAALRGILALVVGWIGGSLGISLTDRYLLPNSWRTDEVYVTLTNLLLALLVLALAAVFVAGYARALRPIKERRKILLELAGWMPARLNSPLGALVWKDCREIGAVSVQVLAASLLLWLLMGPPAFWLGGFALAVLIGVGSVGPELEPAVNTFWRSRPISASTWYWSKFALGLAAIVVTMGPPTMATFPSNYGLEITQKGFFATPLLWLVAYSLAMTMTCLVRQSVQGGILGVGSVAVLYGVLEACFDLATPGDFGTPITVFAPVFVAALVTSALAGWWLAVKDYSIAA